jgi:hypothetical protein
VEWPSGTQLCFASAPKNLFRVVYKSQAQGN